MNGSLTAPQMNLIYLSLQTQRVPIIPFFTPTHIAKGNSQHGPTIDFGEVFDVPRFAKGLGKPVLEWWQVKVSISTFLYASPFVLSKSATGPRQRFCRSSGLLERLGSRLAPQHSPSF
jgi:hypothetical protein